MIRLIALPFLLLLSALSLAAEEPARPVISEIVTGKAMTSRLFPGVIAAEVETTLGFLTAGRIATRPVDLGDSVEKGAVLAKLDQVTLAEDVAAARAALASARALADYAAQSLKRTTELHRRGVASEATLEAAQAEDLSARAEMQAAEAELARAEDAERYGTLTAPAAGVVSSVLAEPGTVVNAGTPVVRLATMAGREAVIDVPDEVLAVLPENAQFTVATRYEDALVTSGRLRLIEPVADASTRAHRLRISLSDAGRGFRLGALISARLDLPEATLLTVPRAAVWMDGDQPKVWRIGADRRANAAPISLGRQVGANVVVTAGLAEGDEVLIRGIHSVQEGQTLGARLAP